MTHPGTHVRMRPVSIATWITLASLVCCLPCRAGELSVSVVDRNGHGVDQVVVTATPSAGTTNTASATAAPTPGVMDQRNRLFVPRLLVVAVGSSVQFPNNDTVSHQVYSFSPAKHFQLPLYKGEIHPPVVFDRPGLVVLGCNIHDSMVGYIYVTPAPYFGSTDAHGALLLKDLPEGDYQIVIWSPYIADAPATLTRSVRVEGTGSRAERFQLKLGLRDEPEPKPHRENWDY
jgi:plastocyanin